MPELPEVETVRRGLQGLIIGKEVKSVQHDTPKSFPNAVADVEAFLISASVIAVRRRAKVLLIDLSTDYTLVIHLKMTGQLVYVGLMAASMSKVSKTASRPSSLEHISGSDGAADVLETLTPSPERFGAGHPSDSLVGQLPDQSTRVTFTFTDGAHLYFNDQRKFGWVRLMPTVEVPNIDFMQKVGPEPLEADFTVEEFAERFKRRAKTSIKAALLDQTVVAGVGNIYADESLWGARLHPLTLVGNVTHEQFQTLYTELRAVMNLAIEKGGSTDRNYVNAEGKKGSYIDFARVFRQEGKPCPRCQTPIIKFRAAGRGTHSCPQCQVIQ